MNIPQIPTNVLGDDSYDVVDSAVYKYNNHPSILKIMDKFPVISERFEFQLVYESYVFDVMKKIKSGKVGMQRVQIKRSSRVRVESRSSPGRRVESRV